MGGNIINADAKDFINSLEDRSVSLLLTDPPYFGIVEDSWDNQWKSEQEFVDWLVDIFVTAKPKLKPNASLLYFGGVGKHKCHPFFKSIFKLEGTYHYRNLLTWKKLRGYGKSHDYLFCREEIAWFSVSSERTEICFNVPYTSQKRGYDGWDKKYPAKSEYKRVSNVWADIPELMRPERTAQKPPDLMKRLIETHSNPGDLIIDPFSGFGSTGLAALKLDRRFLGSEINQEDAQKADERLRKASNDST